MPSRLVGSALLVTACAATTLPEPAGPAPAASSVAPPSPAPSASPSPAPSASSAAAPSDLPTAISATAARGAGVGVVEIHFPAAEQRILLPKADGYRVRLRVTAAPAGSELLGVLDDGPVRSFDPRTTELGLRDLVPEHLEIVAGSHWLVLALSDRDGHLQLASGTGRAPWAAVHFHVGDRGAPDAPRAPHVVVLSPRGTLNGAAHADAALLQYLVLSPDVLGASPTVRARVTLGSRTWEATGPLGSPFDLKALPSGDLTLRVEVAGQGAQAQGERTITVNRELVPR